MYKLFIDDERDPPIGEFWVTVRNYDDAISYVKSHGSPYHISYDHDLGPDSKTGFDIAKTLIDMDLDNEITMSPSYYVHSQNPVGKKNIEGLITSYFNFKGF